ncbi:hypothetical protein [Pelagibacterium lacus]|uniref:Uncharacterized protein n=1 Tax=Pelagibacterium lacus TaxID=2282655 RepID=A0A369W8C1_9HYPH|nr:hypothetical protein [Pelagibacterium lacus]RDE09502.1 hypothetical protein DVH29_06780 [Pelagibacterium lacus]
MSTPIDTTSEDFITIIAPSMAEVMASYKAQRLAERQYSIVHRAGKHSFTMADGEPLFEGTPMIAATFARRG